MSTCYRAQQNFIYVSSGVQLLLCVTRPNATRSVQLESSPSTTYAGKSRRDPEDMGRMSAPANPVNNGCATTSSPLEVPRFMLRLSSSKAFLSFFFLPGWIRDRRMFPLPRCLWSHMSHGGAAPENT